MPIKLPLAANYNSLQNSDVLFSDTIYSATLSASTDTTLAVPLSSDLGGSNTSTNNYLVARIRKTAAKDVWFANNAVAASPVGNSLALVSSELLNDNVTEYKVKSGDTLHFYTTASSVVISVAFYWMT
jgi:hypothetical protein